jgi:hypothetical protein
MSRPLASRVAAAATSLVVASTLVILDAGPVAAATGDAPEPPDNLRVEVLEPEHITLTWDPVAGATEYKVAVIPLEPAKGYARTETGDPVVALDGLVWDVPYKVTVRAFVPTAYPNSYTDIATITATTPLPEGYTLPGAPTNLRVERDPRGELALVRWDAGESTGPLRYQIHLESADVPELTGQWGLTTGLSFDANALPITGGLLAPGQSVSMWVTATDQIYQQSPPSEAITFTCCPL